MIEPRRFSCAMGSGEPARIRAPGRHSLCNRLRHAHRAQPGAGGARRLPGAFGERGAQRPRVSVFGSIGRGQDDDFAPGAARRDSADRRNLIRAPHRRRIPGLRHAVRRRPGQAGRKYCGAAGGVVLAGPGTAQSCEPDSHRRKRRGGCCATFCFLPTMPAWSSGCFASACEFVIAGSGLRIDLSAR